MSPPQYDVIVVGAGIFGSCTAYHCQKLGLRTLLLEQFTLGHSNGSSHGKSRIIRYAHTEPEYVPLVGDTYTQIEELEKKRGEKLWNKLGLLWAATGNQVNSISGHLKGHGIEHEVVKGEEIANRYPQFKFDNSWTGLIDPMGGLIRENEAVLNHAVNPDSTMTIKTPAGTYITKKVIFTVGCWITKFFPNVNFEIKPISLAVCYWNAKEDKNRKLLSEEQFPVVIIKDLEKKEEYLGLPDVDYSGAIKFLLDDGDALNEDLGHPDKYSEELLDLPARFIENHIPVVDGSKPYRVSPDHHYVIGPISQENPNILVGGCGSGTGFKTAPGIGRALAEMAAGKDKTTVDVSKFSPARFGK